MIRKQVSAQLPQLNPIQITNNEGSAMTAHNQLYWEERWHSALTDSAVHRRRKKGDDAMQRWNKMAGDFAERTGDKENVEKREKTLDRLRPYEKLVKNIDPPHSAFCQTLDGRMVI